MKKALIISAIVLVVLFVLVALLLKLQANFMGTGTVSIKKGSILVADLSKAYPERGGYSFEGFRFKRKGNFLSLVRAIERAGEDDDIIALVLKPTDISMNFAQIQELSEAIEKFKKSDKPVYCYLESAGMRSYMVASLTDTVSMTPSGNIMFLGMSIASMFFAGTADKLGIGFDVIQMGKYKGAAESFTERRFSGPLRESLTVLLDGIYGHWISHIAKNRELTEEYVAELIEYGVFDAEDAMERGLVDTLEYPNEFHDRMLSLVKGDDDRIIGIRTYTTDNRLDLGKKNIALIYGIGSIHTGKSEPEPFGRQETIGSKTFTRAIEDAAEDDDIKAIVLRVDSPGGSALASDLIWNSVVEAKKEKPIIVSMGGTAASGGYYISMAADSIFCDPATITGSIGVIFLKPNIGALLDDIGVTVDTINRGALSDELVIHKAMDPEGYDAFTRLIAGIYEDFTSKAAEGRKMELDSLLEIAQGRIWLGSDAVVIGLVDRTAGLAEAIEVAADMAEIEHDKIKIAVYPPEKSFFELAFEDLSAPGIIEQLPEPLQNLLAPNLEAAQLYIEGEPLALMPFRFSW